MGLVGRPLFPRLAKRFLVRQGAAEELETGTVLVPTTNADDLLRTGKIARTTGNAQLRTDTYTVPSGKRWRLQNIYVYRADASATADTGTITDTNGNAVKVIYQTFSGAESMNNLTGTPSSPLILEQGWTIVIDFTTSGVAASLIESAIFYEEEDAF